MNKGFVRAVLCIAIFMSTACGRTGFVALSEPVPAASPAKPLPIYATKNIDRPYQVLGYVFRSTEGHKSGLEQLDDFMYVMRPGAEEVQEIKREALARGADAIIGFEMIPTLNGWGQPVGFSVGGLAVRFLEEDQPSQPPSSVPEPPTPETQPNEASETTPSTYGSFQ